MMTGSSIRYKYLLRRQSLATICSGLMPVNRCCAWTKTCCMVAILNTPPFTANFGVFGHGNPSYAVAAPDLKRQKPLAFVETIQRGLPKLHGFVDADLFHLLDSLVPI